MGMGARKGHFLSFMGPAVVLLIVLAWMLALTVGSALIIHPNLGTAFKALHTETHTDFTTAMLVGSHSFVIASDNNYLARDELRPSLHSPSPAPPAWSSPRWP